MASFAPATATWSLHVGPHLAKDDLMCGQGRPQILVHRRITKSHRQHVGDGSAVAIDDLAARLGQMTEQNAP